MKLINKILALSVSLIPFVSCSSLPTEVKREIELKYIGNASSDINNITKENFKLENLDYVYEGEVFKFNTKINDNIVVEKADTKDNKVIITLKDLKSNKTNTIELNQTYTTKKLPEIKDNTRYKHLKKGLDNNRVRYNVVVFDDDSNPFTRKVPFWDMYFKNDKYDDLDDVVGTKKVKVRVDVGQQRGKELVEKTIDFGLKLEDFNSYGEILTDLDKTTLKFSKDGKSITGGFDPDVVNQLKKQYNTKDKKRIEFVTEIVDRDKNKVGNHTVVRKILFDGEEIYRKKEYAHVGFHGTTVAVADSSFFDFSPAVEKRTYRMINKEWDKRERDENDKLRLDRPHGTSVVGSMIDEIALGKGAFWYETIYSGLVRSIIYKNGVQGQKGPIIYGGQKLKDNKTKTEIDIKNEADVVKYIKNYYDIFKYNIKNNGIEGKILTDRMKAFEKKLDEFEVLKFTTATLKKEEKEKILKDYLFDVYTTFEDVIMMTEDEKLAYTDLHFKVVPIDNGSSLDSSIFQKAVPRIFEEDKNVKAVNMSYGTNYNFDIYHSLVNMTQEQKEKAVEAYNNNQEFRTAIHIWLDRLDGRDRLKDRTGGSLGIPSMLKYFKSRDKITVEDYQKLLDMQIYVCEYIMSNSAELAASNEDILFVVAQGNTLNNSSQTDVDLVNFTKDGKKVIFKDGNANYGNDFLSTTNYYNYKEQEKAKKEGREFKYNHYYRKNSIGVVGLSLKLLNSGAYATENIHDDYALSTSLVSRFFQYKIYAKGMDNYYDLLTKEKEKINNNPNKYPEAYKNQVEAELKTIDAWSKLDKLDPDGRVPLMSFSRAGKEKLMTVAAEGLYTYIKELSDEEKKHKDKTKPLESNGSINLFHFENHATTTVGGSSFAAPRVTAIAGVVGTKFPWMSAHQIKQTIFTTADDDYRMTQTKDGFKLVGIYGVDENIGWGIVNKNRAYNGPARFVKALTRENGEDDFIANIPYGSYEFANDIEGEFDILKYMQSRGELTLAESIGGILGRTVSEKDVLGEELYSKPNNKAIKELFEKEKFDKKKIYTEVLPKVEKYLNELPYEEKEMFEGSGLVKKGKGRLILSGYNTYTKPTIVEEGTLIVMGNSESPITVSEGAKLKLDLRHFFLYRTIANRTLQAKINANIENAGELYSYSNMDTITASYIPKENSRTNIAAIAKLSINNLDLSQTNYFDFDIFRKRGMNVFDKKNENEREILTVSKLSKKDLHKVNVGEFELTPEVTLKVEKHDIENDSENVKLTAKLVKKEVNSTGIVPRAKREIMTRMAMDETDIESVALLNEAIETLTWMDASDRKKLKGEVLANSLILGYELVDLKNNVLLNNIVKGRNKKASISTNVLSNTKFVLNKEKGDKLVTNNGLLLRLDYSTNNTTYGLGLNYINSVLHDYALPIKGEDKTLQGNVIGHNIGSFGYITHENKNVFVKGILNTDLLLKKISREVNGKETSNVSTRDLILNLNVLGGYNFLVNKKLTLSPFTGLDTTLYIKGHFDENLEFGYESETQTSTKIKALLGLKGEYIVNNKLCLGFNTQYSKYLTSPVLTLKANLKAYDFNENIKGIQLEDHIVNYGLSMKYNITDRLNVNVQYQGKNLNNHSVNLGFRFEF